MHSNILCISLRVAQLKKKILALSLLSETSEFFEIAFFTSGLKNGEKYMYVTGRVSTSCKCFISAVTYYPIVLKPKIYYNEVWLMLSVLPHGILMWKLLWCPWDLDVEDKN